MNGAESLVRTLFDSGVEVCFANPGTSEMHFVSALETVPGMRAVLGLFEGVVTGMADGYGRITGRPAVTLLHLGPGLANGLANLHNARRACTPVVNVVGDHATFHAQYDAPLTSDLAGFARPVSGWLHSSPTARSVAADGARAVQAALDPPGQVATLILPADAAWDEAEGPAPALPVRPPASVGDAAVARVAAALGNPKRTGILIRGAALGIEGLTAAGRIAAAVPGARLLCDTFTARLERGAGIVAVERLPYFGEQIAAFLADIEQLILVGSTPPVSFFAYPGKPSWCTPDGVDILTLAHPHEDGVGALTAVADALDAPRQPAGVAEHLLPEAPTGPLDARAVARVVARLLPEGAIVADESATAGAGVSPHLATAAPHTHLSLTGGSIGCGLPLATGAAVGAPERKVVCLHGDGGAMYTVQALWTQARERLDVTTVIFANRAYAILKVELARTGTRSDPRAPQPMMDLTDPSIDWVALANGMGVEATRVESIGDFTAAFGSAMNQRGPRLIEVVL